MKLLLARGADPKINTVLNVSPLHVAAGIGWVEGITYEWSPKATLEAVKMLVDLGLDVNLQADTGRTGAARRGAQGARRRHPGAGRPRRQLDVRDYGNTDNRGGKLAVHTWQPVDYADGLVRVGRAVGHPASRGGRAAAQAAHRKRAAGAAHGPHSRVDLYYRSV
jgi:hypothetical protein